MPEKYNDTRYRPRLAIPRSDTQTLEWIQTQTDLSASVRRLIRDSISRYGMVDVDCLPVKPGVHPGRPRKDMPNSGIPEMEMEMEMEEVADDGTAT